jgi:tetratricopeptide (TPR) repeat protein
MRHNEEAEEWKEKAEAARGTGDTARAIGCLQRAIALYAMPQEDLPPDDRALADACRWLAELLEKENRLPEAMQAYQEAADAYGRVPGEEAKAHECAQRILSGVRALWRKPEERLYLLTARHERAQRQLSATPGTEEAQADCAFRIATIFHRQERCVEAVTRYRESLALYERAPDTGLKQALCHHRLAAIYHYDLKDRNYAVEHYRRAIRLYGEFEPLSEGEQMNRVLCEQLLQSVLERR